MANLRTITLLLFLSVFGAVAFAQSPTRIICFSTIDPNYHQPLYMIVFDKKKVRYLAKGKAPDSIAKILDSTYIESSQMLKDVAATAIYGSRAQNGVVIINIKKQFAKKAYKQLEQYFD